MKLFIDSANLSDIRIAASWGVIDGVTTNPTLVAKEGADFRQRVLDICEIVNGPVSAEVMSFEADKMIEEARELAGWHKNVVIKIPCTSEGIKATKALSHMNIKTNVTLVFSPNQALLAAKANATYISLFVGRLEDAGEDWAIYVKDAVQVITHGRYSSQLIIASIRNTEMVHASAILGAPIATVPFKVLEQMFKHPLTNAGIERFIKDWDSVKSKSP